MKRNLAVLAALVMILSLAAGAYAQEAQPEQRQNADTLVVGHTTMLSGNFFSELWGNNTADIDVRSLIHEYPLIAWTNNGEYQVNGSVVRALETTTAVSGDRTYTVTLHEDLRYSDGSAITAKDFVFNFLLMSSPQIRELSGLTVTKDYILGFAEYTSETSPFFSGIRLLDELSFSVTVTAENLPYYFELSYINNYPLPYKVLVPGSDIADDGTGAYIVGDFTAETLRETLLNPQTGYISHPTVTSGPYKLVRYESVAREAEFELNTYYKGNYEGQVPVIPKLLFREIKNENIVSELAEGKVDLINKVSDGTVIDAGIAMAGEGGYTATPYPRTGAGFLVIAAEKDITASVTFRQALAYSLDYEVLPRDFLKGHGERIYGYYGLSQWMATEMKPELARMQPYELNLEKAAELLAEDGWTLDASGAPYDSQSGTLRHKQFGNAYLPLSLTMAVTESNAAADMVAAMLKNSLEQLGGELKTVRLPLDAALRQYYRQDARQFDVLFMGTNFTYLFDPSNTFLVGDQYQGTMNTSGVQDDKLAELAKAITEDQPGNRFAYLGRWMDFQRYWSEVLPMIPLYGNTYYDLYTNALAGYFPQFYWNWGTAVLYAALNR
ncbi:MAG: ABC transporter substrate-binding protein [Clostridiales bacterium]|nr:ABC transporter substrate-binding protein [Clostridiales bacterium]